jgi:hypothetical protein
MTVGDGARGTAEIADAVRTPSVDGFITDAARVRVREVNTLACDESGMSDCGFLRNDCGRHCGNRR